MMVNMPLYSLLLIAKLKKKTAEYCFEKMIENIENLQKATNNEIFALVTDNENKMTKMRQLTTESTQK